MEKKKRPLSHTLLAGGIAGFVESSICHPLDTIKTRMQLRENYLESIGTRLKHSLVEPAVLRLKSSLSEPSSITNTSTRGLKHSLVEPANLVKLRRHSHAEPLLVQFNRTVGNTSTSTKKSVKTPSSTLLSTRKTDATKCWWNQPNRNNAKAVTIETFGDFSRSPKKVTNSFSSKHEINSSGHTKSTVPWWKWQKNAPTAIVRRGVTSKSAAWCQPLNRFDENIRKHSTLSKNCSTNAIHNNQLGPLETARKIVRREGFLSLYKGLSAVYIGIIPKMAIRFVSFEYYKELINMHTSFGDKLTNFTAGLSSGLTEAVLIVTPAEVCKIRMQSQRHSLLDPVETNARKYGNVVQTAIVIIREEGYSALYKGVVPTMLRQGCNQAVNFTAYNFMKSCWLQRQQQQYSQKCGLTRSGGNNSRPSEQLPGIISMLIGGLSGAMGPIFNNPADVVKTRLQKQNITKNNNGAPKYTGFGQACIKIAKEEGAGALWKGITPRLMRIVPGQAITFTTYEAVCRWL